LVRAEAILLVEYYSSRGARIARIPVSVTSTAADHYAAFLRQTAED